MNLIRWLLGERRGMSAGNYGETIAQAAWASLLPSIVIQTIVLLADVSFYQGIIDFVKMKAAGVRGVIVRAGQRYWVDSQFAVNWQKAKAAGLPRGSYWFYDSREDPKRQAALWWAQIMDDVGELFHVADLEDTYGGIYANKASYKAFIDEFLRLSGLPDTKLVIYTGFYWWQDHVGNDLYFKRFLLWLAWYSPMANVRVPLPWSENELVLWQYTSAGNGAQYGVSSAEIDLNWYCCDGAKFDQLAGITPGGTMYYKATGSITIRSGAGTSFSANGDYVLTGDVLEVSEVVNGFAHIVKLWRNNVDTPLNNPAASWCGTLYLTLTDFIPPVTVPSVYVTHVFSDTLIMDGKQYKADFTVENVEYKPVP